MTDVLINRNLKYVHLLNGDLFKLGLWCCHQCDEVKDISEYAIRKKSKTGHAAICKSCDHQRRRAERRPKKKVWTDMCGGKCVRCGYDESISALTFHHVNKSEKEGPVSAWITHAGKKTTPEREERIRKEVDKCVLLCANCHFAFHSGEIELKFKKRNGLGWTTE